MSRAVGFCDLNIPTSCNNLKKTVLKALSLGYRTIALNTVVEVNEKGKKGLLVIPRPEKFELKHTDLVQHNITKPYVILNRLTIVHGLSDTSYIKKFANVIEEYDIVAVTPKTVDAFQQWITSPSIDFDILFISDIKIEKGYRRIIRRAAREGFCFEFPYSLCISATGRMKALRTAYTVQQACRVTNIIITSSALMGDQLRHPHDVMNLGRFLGLSEGAARNAIAAAAHDVVYCALARRKGAKRCVAEVSLLEPKKSENEHKKFKGLEDARSLAKKNS